MRRPLLSALLLTTAIVAQEKPALVGSVECDCEVVLEKAKPVPVTVVLPRGFPIPEAPGSIEVCLEWVRRTKDYAREGKSYERPENGLYPVAAFDVKREVVLWAMEPGRHRLSFSVEMRFGPASVGWSLDHDPDAEFEIEEGDEGLRLEAEPDRAELKAFLDSRK